jgi:hypothetical protein
MGRTMNIERTDNGITLDGLPVYVVDDDFIEHLLEMGYDESIEEEDLQKEWAIWLKENVEA